MNKSPIGTWRDRTSVDKWNALKCFIKKAMPN